LSRAGLQGLKQLQKAEEHAEEVRRAEGYGRQALNLERNPQVWENSISGSLAWKMVVGLYPTTPGRRSTADPTKLMPNCRLTGKLWFSCAATISVNSPAFMSPISATDPGPQASYWVRLSVFPTRFNLIAREDGTHIALKVDTSAGSPRRRLSRKPQKRQPESEGE